MDIIGLIPVIQTEKRLIFFVRCFLSCKRYPLHNHNVNAKGHESDDEHLGRFHRFEVAQLHENEFTPKNCREMNPEN